jgi:hypothetical protein
MPRAAYMSWSLSTQSVDTNLEMLLKREIWASISTNYNNLDPNTMLWLVELEYLSFIKTL